MFDLVISGKVVDPIDGVYDANLMISKNKIEKIKDRTMPARHSIQLTSSQLIFPGFIDPHVHMREPGWEYKEDFLSGSKAALHGGVTTVADMPNLPESITNKERMLRKIELSKKALVDVLHLGGVGKNSLLDISELAKLVPAFKIYTAASTGGLTLKNWNQIEEAAKIISQLKKPITFHCEDQEIIDMATKNLENKNYPWKHCDERPKESETSAVQKVLELCKKHRTITNIAHISAAESLSIVNENRESISITCEVTPHHLFFRKEDMRKHGNLLKVNPPLRSESERRALLRALKKGRVDMLATDHAPHTIKEKVTSAPAGVPGLDTYGNFVLWLMSAQRMKPELLARITSYNAADYLNIKNKARIKENFVADLVILDKKGKTKIENKNLYTKCGWSPFDGIMFPGRIICTIKSGRIAMRSGIVF